MTRKELDQLEAQEANRLAQGLDRFRAKVSSIAYRITPENYTQIDELIAKQQIADLCNATKISVTLAVQKSMQGYYNAARAICSESMDDEPSKGRFDHDGYLKNKTAETVKYFYAAVDRVSEMASTLLYFTGMANRETLQLQQLADQHRNWTQSLEDDIYELIDDARVSRDYVTLSGDVIKDTYRTRGDVQRAILNTLKEKFGDLDFIEINGRHYNIRYYIELVARSEMRMAGADAAINTAKEWGSDLVKFSKHGDKDGRCLPYEDQIMSISGQHPKYPPVKRPVYDTHPNCKHHLNPITERTAARWERERQEASR